MKDMSTTPAEAAAYAAEPTERNEAPEYPYGLRISLSDASMQKLGISGTPSVGAKFTLHGMACVISSTTYENKDDGQSRSAELQIEMLDMAPAAREPGEMAQGMYPSMKS